jgi:hypothetical protein
MKPSITREEIMYRTRCTLILVLVAAATATGCVSHSMVTPEVVTPRSELRLRFEPPRVVTLRTGDGETLVLERVEEMRGRIFESQGDSLVIRTTHAKYDGRRTRQFGTGAVASVAHAGVELAEIESNTGGTIALAIALGLVVALVVAVSTATEPPPPPPKESTK